MELNGHLGNLINLPVQFWILVLGFIYIKNLKLSIKDVCIICIFLFIPTVLLYLTIYWMGTIFFILSLITYFYFYTKKSSVFIYISILFLFAIVLDHIASLIVYNLPDYSGISQLLLRITVFVILYIIFLFIFKKIEKFHKMKFNFSFNVRIILMTILLVTLIVFYSNVFRFFNNNYELDILKTNIIIFTVYLILILALIVLLLYIVVKEQRLDAREKEYENFSTYISSLEQVNKDMQKFRHDYLNILLSMESYISEKDWKGLESYFEKDILKFEKKTLTNNKILGNLEKLQVKGLKGLLMTKCIHAIENDLNISIEIIQPIEKINMDIIELSRTIGILIDNAIENCLMENRKEIQIAIIQQNSNLVMFVIRNQIEESNININQLFDEGFTTKENGQGMGLTTVKNIVNSNSNTILNIWVEHNWFCVELLIMEG